MKTNELLPPALDWAVTKAEELDYDLSWFRPSTDWLQGGQIIEREGISVEFDGNIWCAISDDPVDEWVVTEGPTPLIAAMRCYVASKLGDEVTLPEELK